MLRLIYAGTIDAVRRAVSSPAGGLLSQQDAVRRSCLAQAFELSLFLLLAVASTWPLVTRLDSAVPRGSERVATVPLFNLWTIWWNADRAGSMFDCYWDAPIFAPSENTFALSESQPTTVAVAPVVWILGSRTLAYNVYLLSMLALNGWCGSLLVGSLTRNRLVGIWAGAALLLLPFVHWQLGVLQLTSISGVLLTLHFLIRFIGDLRLKDAVLAGVSIGFCYLSCNYYGYQLCLVLLFSSIALLVKHSSLRRLVVGAVVITLVAGLMVLPVVGVQLSISGEQSWDRKLDTVWRLSALPPDYLRSLWRGPLVEGGFGKPRFPLSPGAACLVLVAVGSFTGLRRRENRRMSFFILLFLFAALFLSLGPTLTLGGQVPFLHLAEWLPGLSAMRSPYRFAVLVQVGCVVLAGMSFARSNSAATTDDEDAAENVPTSVSISSPTRTQRISQWGRIALLCGVLIESWPAKPGLYSMPEYNLQRPWIEWLRTETQSDDIVASLPFPSGRSVADYEDTTVAMLWSTFHKRRLANGYSGFFPKEFVQLKANVQSFPDEKSVRELRKAGVRWCVVDVAKLGSSRAEELSSQPLLSMKFESAGGRTRIYEIERLDQ